MNREALRRNAHNGCVQPVRGSYGAIRIASRRRPRPAMRPWSILVILLLVGGGVAAYFLLAGALLPQPSLRIISPTSDAMVSGGKATVVVEVRNAELGAARGDDHLHYYLDAEVPTAHGRPAIPTTGAWASTTKTTHEWTVSGVGVHTLAVQLVTSDDRPLSPPVIAAVLVRVSKSAPSPAPAAPQPTSPVK
jgi:hypothetical protein